MSRLCALQLHLGDNGGDLLFGDSMLARALGNVLHLRVFHPDVILAQALPLDVAILSPDPKFDLSGVRRMW